MLINFKCVLNRERLEIFVVARRTSGDCTMPLSKAEELLMTELQYSKERAQFIVRQFDRNGDGKLSTKEMEQFKDSVKQTSVE